NLGEMVKIGIPVPQAFIVTAFAYFYFLVKNNLRPKIKNYLSTLNLSDPDSLDQVSSNIKKAITTAEIPKEVSNLIIKNYSKLGSLLKPALVAVRSSATAEDLPTASFAGQQETFLNITGEAAVVDKVRQCWASLFTPRAIFYREEQKFDHFKVGIAVPVQKMIQAETSGVTFTIDPVTHEKKKIVIEAIYGLGELIVQGQVIPDRYEVDKDKLQILKKEIASQDKKLIKKGLETKGVAIPYTLRDKQKLTDGQIIKIAEFGKKIENHYFFPQDIEWAIEKGKIYIVQTRPVTTIKEQKLVDTVGVKLPHPRGVQRVQRPVLTGIAASPGIATGPVKLIHSAKEINRVASGDILVTEMTNPDFVPAMRKAVAIVTDKGGRTAHAAIVSRELGIPCIVGTKTATKLLKTGQVVTVNGGTGEIFRGGIVQSSPSRSPFGHLEGVTKLLLPGEGIREIKTATKVYVNLAEPERAREIAKLPVDGIGLLRAEFMIAQIGVHPKKIIHDRKQNLFVQQLSSNLAVFCEAFSPRPVVYRTTDFKTNEYRNLTGGKDFEPEEENPLLGYRGAYRYLADPGVFELELEALKIVRNKMGFKNLWTMIPFVRTPKELLEVKKIIASQGLVRSPSFKIWLMVELPANVILLDKFIEVGIDGVSIGSNDLTMLILGVDRDNTEVAQAYNEQDPAVLCALEKTIKTCQKMGITSSICGQAPSDYPDLVEKLVKWGITSVSVNPDAIERTREIIYETEKRLCLK
ncbi:phosphoenolpyruvate synthase, partial [Candidatus Gottesmanbacteria bacterium]|nr:phosphoenolpyruvate synthase [Candidatus Gottesmanbacteria bacterium]